MSYCNQTPTRISLHCQHAFPPPSSCAPNRPLNHSAQALWLVDLSAWLNSRFHHVIHRTDRMRRKERGWKNGTVIRGGEWAQANGIHLRLHTDDDRHFDQRGRAWICKECKLLQITPKNKTFEWEIPHLVFVDSFVMHTYPSFLSCKIYFDSFGWSMFKCVIGWTGKKVTLISAIKHVWFCYFC